MNLPAVVRRWKDRFLAWLRALIAPVGRWLGMRLQPAAVAWEGLAGQVQVAIAYPVLTVLLFLLHLGPLNQPTGRAIFYGLFWAIPATALVVMGTRNEAAKRRGEQPQDPNPPFSE